MKKFLAIAMLLGFCSGGRAAALSAADVASSIQHSGAKTTIADLERREQWQIVTDMVATGDPAWIELIPKLARGSDELATDELAVSLSYALPKNAPFVLAVLSVEQVIGTERVCSMPFADDLIKDRPAYKRQALQALDQVTDHALAATRISCQNTLKRAE